MNLRFVAALVLVASAAAAASATVFAADDHHRSDDALHAHLQDIARDVRHAVHDSLREARHEIGATIREVAREVRRSVRGSREQAARDWQSDRVEREVARARAREVRARAREVREHDRDVRERTRTEERDARDRERAARAFRQVSPTDDPCADRRGDRDRGHACEVRDTRLGAPGSALAVDATPNGGIRVEGWDQPDVLVRAVVQTWAETDAEAQQLLTAVRVNAAGARVTAEGPAREDGRRRHGWSVSYRIWAPRQTALDLVARNGGVSVVAMQGDARFTTTNGGVTLDDIAGHFVGRTSNGGVTVRLSGARWEGAGLDVETTNGGVNLTLPRDYSAALEVSTVNGGLRSDFPVALPDGRPRDLRTTLGSGGPLIKVRTVNGGVRLSAR